MEQIVTSLYNRVTSKNATLKTFEGILNDIQTGIYEKDISDIRNAIAANDKELADKLKVNTLPGFTPSGTFIDRRKKDSLKTYSNLLHLDIDKLAQDELFEVTRKLTSNSLVHAFFVSPSGNGIKVFVKTSNNEDDHRKTYVELTQYFEEYLGVTIDPSCKDISRLCFVSHDPDLYYNSNSEIFDHRPTSFQNGIQPIVQDCEWTLDECYDFTNNRSQYVDGNRNNYIFHFACNANRWGIELNETIQYCCSNFDLDDLEISSTVKGAYSRNKGEFANFAKIAKLTIPATHLPSQSEFELNLPTLPTSVYERIPEIIRKSTNNIHQDKRKDIWLLGTIALLSSCIPEVWMDTFFGVSYGNQYFIVLGPPASGKSILNSVFKLIEPYDELLDHQYTSELDQYERDLSTYESTKDKSNVCKPRKPKRKTHAIPGNISKAGFEKMLSGNKGVGIMMESELDTIGNNQDQAWGHIDDIFRKAFHHETISNYRITDNQYTKIKNPKFALICSGTPEQILKIIPSSENGLFSRCHFYYYEEDFEFINLKPSEKTSLFREENKRLAHEVTRIITKYSSSEFEFKLNDDQWDEFYRFFNQKSKAILDRYGNNTIATMKRMGSIFLRISMVLSTLRHYESKDTSKTIYCDKDSFKAAESIITTLLKHNLLVLQNLPSPKVHRFVKRPDLKEQLLEKLNDQFTRGEAVQIGLKLGLAERSIDLWLKQLTEQGILQKLKSGLYVKSTPEKYQNPIQMA